MDIKGAFRKASFRYGSYSMVLTGVVLAILIVVNLLVRQLPANLIYWDLSEQKLYSVGDVTKEFVLSLQEDVTIYLVCASGSEDATLQQLLETYGALSDHIKISQLDPNKNFVALQNFGLNSDSSTAVQNNSLVVASEKRYKYISVDQIFELDESYYMQYQQALYNFDGEGEITSALSYVTSTDLPKMYAVTGHGEYALSEKAETITSMIEKANIEMLDINLLTGDIPLDCDVLLLNTPARDYSAEEAEKIKDYLDAGGNVLALTYYAITDCPNYDSIFQYYGIERQGGLIYEASGMYISRPYNLIVSANGTHSIMKNYSPEDLVLVLQAQGLAISDNIRSTVNISPLLSTSEGSYLRVELDKADRFSKIDSDIEGPLYIALAAEDTQNVNTAKMVVFSSPYFVSDEVLGAYPSIANSGIFMDALGWMCSFRKSISIPSKSMNYLSNMYSEGNMNASMIITVFVLPVAVLLVGFVIWYKRRTR